MDSVESAEPLYEGLSGLARQVKMLLLDVDGTLTDGGIIITGQGDELKRFDVQDGMGITIARSAGLIVGIITGRRSEVVQKRADELGIVEIHQGVADKVKVLRLLLQKYNLDGEQIAYIGDDIPDIPVMMEVGLPVAVNNAVQEVKDIGAYTTDATGGHGAVREVIDLILESNGLKAEVIQQIIKPT